MTRYNVTAWCSFPHYTTFEVEARSFADALKKAMQQAPEEYPEPNDGHAFEWDEFQIQADTDRGKSRTYFEPLRRVEMAAQDLLNAAEFVLPILEVLTCSSYDKLERKAFRLLSKAVAKAKGGAI